MFLLVCAAQPLRSLGLGLELARAQGFEMWVGASDQWPDLGDEHTEDTTAWWTTVVTACTEAHRRLP